LQPHTTWNHKEGIRSPGTQRLIASMHEHLPLEQYVTALHRAHSSGFCSLVPHPAWAHVALASSSLSILSAHACSFEAMPQFRLLGRLTFAKVRTA